jgi:hypothetical protein
LATSQTHARFGLFLVQTLAALNGVMRPGIALLPQL